MTINNDKKATPKILHVEDNIMIQKLVAKILDKEGYDHFSAEDGEHGINLFQEKKPNIVLLDMMLPGISGLEVLKFIKNKSPSTEVLVISGTADKNIKEQCYQGGADAFLTKPIDRISVLTSIQRSLQIQESTRNLQALVDERTYKLRKSEEKHRSILENIEEGYYEVDIVGNHTFFNESFSRIVGYSKDELMGMNFKEYMDEMNVANVQNSFNKVLETGKTDVTHDWELVKKGGTKRFVEASVTLIRDPENRAAGFSGIMRDITERKKAQQDLENLVSHSVGALARGADVFDTDTGDHTVRIGNYCRLFAKLNGANEDFQKTVQVQAQLHDVGKIHTPWSILNKKGPLTDEEFEIIKAHTEFGCVIIGNDTGFEIARDICLFHHEKWDGTGYPDRLKGEEIPLAARMASIVDVFDALITKRSYKEAFSLEKSKAIMTEGDSRLDPREAFDPELLQVFLENFDAFAAIHKESVQVGMDIRTQKMNILMLEDESLMSESVVGYFEDKSPSAEIIAFKRLAEAKEYIHTNSDYFPDLCFIDLSLPDGSGHDFAKEIRTIHPESVLICVTGEPQIERSQRMLYDRLFHKSNPDLMDKLLKTTETVRKHHFKPRNK